MREETRFDDEMEAWRRQAESALDAAQEGLAVVQSTLAREVRRNPVPAVAMAAGAGLLVGLILSRRG